MFGFGNKEVHRIGIDISRDGLRLAQLSTKGGDLCLLAGNAIPCPGDVDPGTANWQRWAIDVIKRSVPKAGFRGKAISAVLPASEIYIDHIKMPKRADQITDEYILSRIKNRIPFKCNREDTMVQLVASDKDHGMVMAAERTLIDRHLAIYEKAGVSIKALGVWPEALHRCYVNFFGRCESDLDDVVILANIESDSTNIVICRHSNLLYARSIPSGANGLADEAGINRLVMEVSSCRRDFVTMYKNAPLKRLIFMSGPVVETSVYAAIAKQMEVQAQIGDCLVAVDMPDALVDAMDCRDQHISWATAFGLSLS